MKIERSTVEVEKTIKVQEKVYILTLNETEAAVLRVICANIIGNNTFVGNITNNIYFALNQVKGEGIYDVRLDVSGLPKSPDFYKFT